MRVSAKRGHIAKQSAGNALSLDYSYDFLDRLLTVTFPDKSAVHYAYEGHNLIRADRIKNGRAIYSQQYKAYDLAGNLLGLQLPGQAGDAAFHYDLLQRLIFQEAPHRKESIPSNGYDPAGNLLKRQVAANYRYTAFGEERTQGILSPWRFSNKRTDEETGFVYFGRRYYLPTIGRWLTPDPLWFEDGMNLYSYVHNHPLAYTDPDGQFAFLLVPLAISLAAEYCLPTAAVFLGQ